MTDYLNCLYVAVILVIAIFSIIGGFKIVPEFQRLVVFRLGRPLDKPKGPGLVFLVPLIDRTLKVDLREQKREISNQEATTKDFIPVTFDFCWYYRILDPIKAVITVGDAEMAMTGIIIQILRSEIQQINSANLPSELPRLSNELFNDILKVGGEVSEKVGIKITNFEILKLAIDGYTFIFRLKFDQIQSQRCNY